MGAQQSIAISQNYADLSANTNVSTSESCSAQQSIAYQSTTVVIGNANCPGGINVGNVSVSQDATCNNQQQVSILSKIVADQTANSTAKNGIPTALFGQAIAESSNYVDLQNNICAIMQSNCNNSQLVTIGDRSFTAQNISGETCNIFNGNFNQNSVCIQNIQADITNDSEANQTATSSASNGLDLGELLLFLLLILIIIIVIIGSPLILVSGILGVPIKALGGAGKLVGKTGGAVINLVEAPIK